MSWKFVSISICSCILLSSCVISEIAPPGVNPAYYETAQQFQPHQQPGGIPQQGYGGQSIHMNAHFQQQQQMPQQPGMHHQPGMHQQPGMQQQVPHAIPHPQHGGPTGAKPILNAANIQHEKEHIAEHMEVPLDTSKMTEQELQFHYFKMHDSDNNNKLDGCELIKSLIHWHEQGHEAPQVPAGAPHPPPKIFGDEELKQLIDPILKMDDSNQDGYIDYAEFIRAQQKASSTV